MQDNHPNIALEKQLNRVAWLMTVLVLLMVVAMRRVHIDTSIDFSFLPAVYSALNGIVALALILGLYFIKTGQRENHRKTMTFAVVASFLFLVGYVLYHITTEETKFGGDGGIRYLYFFLLITHIFWPQSFSRLFCLLLSEH